MSEGAAPLPVAFPVADPAARLGSAGGRIAAALAWTLLVAFALVTAGAVDPAAGAAISAFFLLHALLGSVAARSEIPKAARIAVAAAIVACVVQLIPLPEAVRAILAPGPTSARADLRALGLQGSWAPISVDVGATVTECVLWAGAAAALAVLARPAGPPVGARLVVGLLVVLHGLAWLDLGVGTRILPLTHIEDPWGVGQDALRHADFAGWLIDRNHWAALGVILWPLAALWASRGGPARRAAGIAAAVAVVGSVLATKSRAGLGIVGLQALVVALVLAARAPMRVRLALLAVLVAGGVLARGPIGSFLDRIREADVVGRTDLYAATSRLALDSPALGWGMGSFQSTFPSVQPDGLLYKYSHAHSDPLEWIAGAGALGLALVLALLAAIVHGARDRRASALSRLLWTLAVAGGAAAACVEFPLHVPALRFVWLGVLFSGPPRDRGPVAG